MQTSNQTEAQTTPSISVGGTLNGGNGVPDLIIPQGRSVTIDLSDYVEIEGAASSTATYHLVAREDNSLRQIWQPAPAAQTGANQPRWNTATVGVSLTGSMLTITPATTGIADYDSGDANSLGTVGNGHRIHWVADIPDGTAPLTTDARTYGTWDTAHTNAGQNKHDFRVTVVAAQADPSASAWPDAPTSGMANVGFLASDAVDPDDATDLYGTPTVWTLTGTALAGTQGGDTNVHPVGTTAFRVVGSSTDDDIAEAVTGGTLTAPTLTITPKSRGTVTIGPIYLVHHAWADNPEDAPTSGNSRAAWRLADALQFTVNYAADAPQVDIVANSTGAPGTFDKDGTEDKEIVYTVRSNHVGEIGRFRTISGTDATYLGRNIIFSLTDSGDQDLFEMETADPYRSTTAGVDHASGTATTVEATLSVSSGAALEVGRTYTFTVVLNDDVDRAPGVTPGGADSVEVTVKVVQGNRPPVLNTLSNLVIPENTSTTAVLLDLNGQATDPDRNTLSYTVEAKDGSDGEDAFDDFFSFPTAAGAAGRYQLTLKKQVNYEDTDYDDDDNDGATDAQKNAVRWTLVVTVSDGSREDSQEITVTVTDSAEVTPTTGLMFSVDENAADGQEVTVGTVRIRPTGANDLLTGYALNPDADGDDKFEITDAGVLTIVEDSDLDYETTPTYLLVVTSGTHLRTVTVNINDVNEAPVFDIGDNRPPVGTATPTPVDDDNDAHLYKAKVSESADVGDTVIYGATTEDPTATDFDPSNSKRGIIDPDGDTLTYSLVAANANGTITSPEVAFSGPFAINASTGAITVSGRLDAEAAGGDEYVLHVKATDDDATNALFDTVKLTITVDNTNEAPFFVTGSGSTTPLTEVSAIAIDENTPSGTVVARYYAVDPDGDDVTFVLRGTDALDFVIDGETGVLTVAAGKTLDYETKASYLLEIEVQDNAAGQGQIEQAINLNNLNDNSPVWQTPHTTHARTALTVTENTLRGVELATYLAVDADDAPGESSVTYSLGGPNGAQYLIGGASGILETLGSLDADTNTSDSIVVTASDGTNSITRDVRVSIVDVNDSIGSITVMMANPVLGTNGDPNSALADRKTTASLAVPEAPGDLPATGGSSVVNFVETAAANWGSVLRVEVLAESPDTNCGNGNQCIIVEFEGNDSDDVLKVMAYRNSGRDNLFVAAVMPVASANMATPGDGAVYKHTDDSVPRIKVDEEDTLRIKFGNLRDDVLIDNEAPEFANFLPEHESSTDDDEVDYTFTVTDSISGIPDPEDLPDADGDDAYMAVAALVNTQQCHNVAEGATPPAGTSAVANTNLHEGAQIYCPSATTPQVRVIVDDKDLDEVTDGFDVDTKVVLTENEISFVTFIACDAAGNCTAFDPDENDTREALSEITVDTADPTLSEARTGVMWDAADNAYDDSRNFIQAIFNDLSKLNPDTIEADDFVVDGYTIRRVYWYDDPDDGDENWTTRYDSGSRSSAYRAISKTVFIELEEELLPDATPDVSVVPNGLEDAAGNEQDDDEVEADDWIAPEFTVTSVESPRTTSRDNVLVGEDEKVTLTVTSDERISTTKPLVDVNAVNAPAGCVDRAGIILRAGRDTDGDNRVEPSEARNDCAVSAKGSPLNSVISKDGTNEWTIVVDKPSTTGYYNVYIYADDRSSQNNRGSEGVAPDKIVTDFFEKDGDVNSDDAVFFEGDVQLPKPQIVVSGKQAGDTEPTVEFKRPLFIEVDFTEPFSSDCTDSDKLSNKIECVSEGAEYAEDGFDTVTVTRFELNGVDMTDDVKTTDSETFLVALDDISIGDHEIKIQATDAAGNELKDVLEIEFEVEERDPFTRRLNPGWNLVSLPGSPEDSAIASVFGSDIEVRTVYTYNPVTPGGWQVAVRESLDDDWQGDLTDITAKSGYWVLSDAIQDLEVSIPRLAGGAVGASTPVQPPVIPMYAGWNLIPVVDVTGDALDTDKAINATTYLNSLDDGLDLARVLGFNTITNEWFTVIDPSDSSVTSDLQIGSAYWVFVRESASLVPGGIPR